jgi:hypothetical protein
VADVIDQAVAFIEGQRAQASLFNGSTLRFEQPTEAEAARGHAGTLVVEG